MPLEEESGCRLVSFAKLFTAFDQKNKEREEEQSPETANASKNAIERHMGSFQNAENMNGIKRIQLCRQALNALDRRGWDRSFHQRMFHEEYLKSCTRVFFKRDGPGAFSRSHSRVLEVNGWDSTPQEILVSTPRYTAYSFLCKVLADIKGLQTFWENHFCLHVCCRYDFLVS
jgi:hypothetical protein